MSDVIANSDCQTIQIIEPFNDSLVDAEAGSSDPAISERGEVILTEGQVIVAVNFAFTKLSQNYRFEYLYVDNLGGVNSGVINAVPILQTILGFTVELAGAPIAAGYILRWRVIVVSIATTALIDAPENLYLQIPVGARHMDIVFVNPRSSTDYGFSELRVENLATGGGQKFVINVMVVSKTMNGFGLEINPAPPNTDYYLKVRTP